MTNRASHSPSLPHGAQAIHSFALGPLADASLLRIFCTRAGNSFVRFVFVSFLFRFSFSFVRLMFVPSSRA
jgi:hypothetical protein